MFEPFFYYGTSRGSAPSMQASDIYAQLASPLLIWYFACALRKARYRNTYFACIATRRRDRL
jgi:hypothetical protein